jgi:hypothetical protein
MIYPCLRLELQLLLHDQRIVVPDFEDDDGRFVKDEDGGIPEVPDIGSVEQISIIYRGRLSIL